MCPIVAVEQGWRANPQLEASPLYPMPPLLNSKKLRGPAHMYAGPISFATDNSNILRCSIVYFPLLRKYFRTEDDCEDCIK